MNDEISKAFEHLTAEKVAALYGMTVEEYRAFRAQERIEIPEADGEDSA